MLENIKIEIYKTLALTLSFSIPQSVPEDHLLYLLQFFHNVTKTKAAMINSIE